MKIIHASELQVGSIIAEVNGNSNIRGTVQNVHRFCNPQAALLPSRNNVPANYKESTVLAHSPVDSNTLRLHCPPPPSEARAAAHAVEQCYAEKPSSVAILIGHRHVTIQADALVKVWVPASEAIFAFSPTR